MQHRVLQRQLKRVGIDPEYPPSAVAWQRFLECVNHTYETVDQDRDLLERSLSISSQEMQVLHEKFLEAPEQQDRAIAGSATDGIVNIDEENKITPLEEWLKIVFEYAPDAYYLNDLKGFFVDGNRAAEELIGYKREELIGRNFLTLNLLSPQQIPQAMALLARNALRKPTGPDEFILKRKEAPHDEQ